MAKIINLFLFTTLLAGLLESCCECPSKPKNHHLLTFIDKSQSINNDEETFSRLMEAQLSPEINKMISNTGDQMKAYLIHGATVSNQSVVNDIFKEPLPCECGMGPQDYRNNVDDYKESLETFQKKSSEKLLNYIKENAIGDVTQETDLLGTLEIISNFMATIPKEDTVMVVYISDMVHSQSAPRDYQIKPIKDLQEANVCAANDYTWIQTHRKINTEAFNRLRIHIIFPSGNYQMSQNDQMMYYWQALLGKLNNTIQISRN